MSDSLSICCDPVMLLVRQMSNLTLEAAQDPLHQCQSLGSTPVVDDDQGLSLRGDSRSMHRVAGDDVDIFGQVPLERCNLWCLNRCLTRHNRSNFRRYSRVESKVCQWYIVLGSESNALSTATRPRSERTYKGHRWRRRNRWTLQGQNTRSSHSDAKPNAHPSWRGSLFLQTPHTAPHTCLAYRTRSRYPVRDANKGKDVVNYCRGARFDPDKTKHAKKLEQQAQVREPYFFQPAAERVLA